MVTRLGMARQGSPIRVTQIALRMIGLKTNLTYRSSRLTSLSSLPQVEDPQSWKLKVISKTPHSLIFRITGFPSEMRLELKLLWQLFLERWTASEVSLYFHCLQKADKKPKPFLVPPQAWSIANLWSLVLRLSYRQRMVTNLPLRLRQASDKDKTIAHRTQTIKWQDLAAL